MSTETILLSIGVVTGAYMAWNIGANDVANSMASAVGAKVLTLRQAIFTATVLTFLGATLVGSHVVQTIRKGIIRPDIAPNLDMMVLGLLAALLAASLWVCLATYRNLPVSTTHSIVGAMIGVGLVVGGPSAVNWGQVALITASWVTSPILSGAAAFFVFRILDKRILSRMDTATGAMKTAPFLVASTIAMIGLSVFLDTPLGEKTGVRGPYACVPAIAFAAVSFVATVIIVRRVFGKAKNIVAENIFRYLQVMTSCYVAFGNGANDVANAMGPLAGIYFILSTGTVAAKSPAPTWMLGLGGAMICVGICTWGYRVIETMGTKITELTSVRGFTVEFSAATMILVASMLGLPVSTTHAAVGAYIGVGLARGLAALDLRVVWNIMLYWVITLPIAALTSAGIYVILGWIFLGR
jgi:PiT family inorganic phosphate transporter